MPVPFTCPQCRSTGTLPDSFTGTRVRCPSCRTISPVPCGDEVDVAPEATKPARPAPTPVGESPKPVRGTVQEPAPARSVLPLVLAVAGGGMAALLVVVAVAVKL